MGCILAIADGVSTGGMGKEAAQTSVTSLVRDYFSTPQTWDTSVALDRIISAQNSWLCANNKKRKPALGLTTLTALVLKGQSYTLAHVGDTRAYLLRGGVLTQLTQDHAVDHPDFQHQLLRCLGAEDHVVVDYTQGDLQVGDVFVLVSDGIYGPLHRGKLDALLREVGTLQAGVQEASQRLLDAALLAGGHDNVTAMLAKVESLHDASLQDITLNAQSLPVPPKLRVGDRLDGLIVTAIVADEGVNLVYQAREPASQTLYAIKTLNPGRAHDPQERAMLAHEAWVVQHLQRGRAAGNLVHLHDHLPRHSPGATTGQTQRSAFYLLYDWHAGKTLQQILDSGEKVPALQWVDLATQMLKTLGALHRLGVIHRDVKPSNLHLGYDGVLRLLDLGAALSGKEPPELRRLHAGSPSYMNPEQWGDKSGDQNTEQLPDAGSDLYALGVTLYQLLTGRLPYGEVLAYQTGRYFRDPTPPNRLNPQVPIWLDHIVLKAVARDRRQRFETAEEMLLALERGASRPVSAPLPSALLQRDPAAVWKIAAAVSLLLNLMLVYWLLFLPK